MFSLRFIHLAAQQSHLNMEENKNYQTIDVNKPVDILAAVSKSVAVFVKFGKFVVELV